MEMMASVDNTAAEANVLFIFFHTVLNASYEMRI